MNHAAAARSDSNYVNYVADILFSDANSVTCSWKKNSFVSRLPLARQEADTRLFIAL